MVGRPLKMTHCMWRCGGILLEHWCPLASPVRCLQRRNAHIPVRIHHVVNAADSDNFLKLFIYSLGGKGLYLPSCYVTLHVIIPFFRIIGFLRRSSCFRCILAGRVRWYIVSTYHDKFVLQCRWEISV